MKLMNLVYNYILLNKNQVLREKIWLEEKNYIILSKKVFTQNLPVQGSYHKIVVKIS